MDHKHISIRLRPVFAFVNDRSFELKNSEQPRALPTMTVRNWTMDGSFQLTDSPLAAAEVPELGFAPAATRMTFLFATFSSSLLSG